MKNISASLPRVFLGLGLVLVLAAAPVFTGCDSNEDGASILDPTSTPGTFGMTPPTLAEVQSAAGLTREEAARLEPALNQWREQARNQEGFRRGDGPGDRPDPPHFEFLSQASKNLTAQQFADVVDLLVERREQFREQRRAEHKERFQNGDCPNPGEGQGMGIHRGDRKGPGMHRGDRRGPGQGGGFFTDLNLTDDQRAPFREAMKTAHSAMRDIHKAFAAGEITAEGVRDQAQAAVDALRSSLQSILDGEQFQTLTRKMEEHRVQMAERRLEHVGQSLDRRVDHLTELLGLDATQTADLENVLNAAVPKAEALLYQVKDGSLGFADALYQGILLHQETESDIRGLLTDDQQVKFDALKKLHRGPRWMRIYL